MPIRKDLNNDGEGPWNAQVYVDFSEDYFGPMTAWIGADIFEDDDSYPHFNLPDLILETIDDSVNGFGEIDDRAARAIDELCLMLQARVSRYRRVDMAKYELESTDDPTQ